MSDFTPDIGPRTPFDGKCPSCDANLIGAAPLHDCTVCIACRALIILDAEVLGTEQLVNAGGVVYEQTLHGPGFLRRPTDEEEIYWLAHPELQAAIRAVAEYHDRHGSPHPNIAKPDDGHAPY